MKKMSGTAIARMLRAASVGAVFLAAGNVRSEGLPLGAGGILTIDGEYAIHTFTNSGMFSFAGGEVDVLLVGGGGGGGSGKSGGGGGGGGGFVYRTGVTLADGVYSIVVGEGGAGAQPNGSGGATQAENGGDSSAFDFVAHGGGRGGNAATKGAKGGSGGGGAPRYISTSAGRGTYAGGAAYEGEGYPGGCSTNETRTGKSNFHLHAWAGGGGGAGEKGGDAVSNGSGSSDQNTTGSAGKGGDGLPCSITGVEVYYAGGGGGGFADYSAPNKGGTVAGGLGGGGRGSGSKTDSAPYPGTDGEDGLGGGGGGGGAFGTNLNAAGGKGGDGVVIVRYRLKVADVFDSVDSAEAVRTRDGAYRVYTFRSNGTFRVSGVSRVDVLLVGGGGGGGAGDSGGGGGGAGGFVHRTGVVISDGAYSITVGSGGAGGTASAVAENGSDSVAFGLTAHGGGHGGRNGGVGAKGGSGGGGAPKYISTSAGRGSYAGGAPFEGEGYPGGCSTNETRTGESNFHIHAWAGGGGGAGEKGGDAVSNGSGSTDPKTTGAAGKGGDGLPCSITGTEVYYAGGGGGGFADYSQPGKGGTVAGGLGGGGRGSGSKTASGSEPYPGTDGEDGLGGGGGGGGAFGSVIGFADGGNGGDGVVIIRCRVVPTGLKIICR